MSVLHTPPDSHQQQTLNPMTQEEMMSVHIGADLHLHSLRLHFLSYMRWGDRRTGEADKLLAILMTDF